MKEIKVRFEEDRNIDYIDIQVRAKDCDRQVQLLIDSLSKRGNDTIAVNDLSGAVVMLPVKEIILLSVDGKLVNIITKKEKYSVRCSLQHLEESLDSRRFMRISRYEIVNLAKVERYDFTLSGTLRLELSGGIETWASRRCIPQIRKQLMINRGGAGNEE
ncbi:MAG: LytTR family transcriptional regulator DNA-binding domain-containing protein [Firmicutes bacterium]|nr:LytTR family transcriptional regulator DNA-binding domain-containing protein [Bacillota bacterium]